MTDMLLAVLGLALVLTTMLDILRTRTWVGGDAGPIAVLVAWLVRPPVRSRVSERGSPP